MISGIYLVLGLAGSLCFGVPTLVRDLGGLQLQSIFGRLLRDSWIAIRRAATTPENFRKMFATCMTTS